MMKKKNKNKILIFGTFFHFTPTHAEEHHINRSYFYRKHYSEQNKTNLKSLSQKLKEESAFEVAKTKVFRKAILLKNLLINFHNIKTVFITCNILYTSKYYYIISLFILYLCNSAQFHLPQQPPLLCSKCASLV